MDPDSLCIYNIGEVRCLNIYKLKGRIPQKHRITTFMNIKFLTIDELNFCLDDGADGFFFFLKRKK